jgi:hypothetical protein
LTGRVVEAHLTGEVHLGLYPLLTGDTCHWLAADFDGPSAMLDALAYLKAARAVGVPAALEVSRSGIGAHVWIFFTAPVPAATARALGSGLLRDAIALRGRMNLTAYDRLFPSQEVLPAPGGIGNLIAAPLQGRSRRHGATLFLDLATLEPHTDQWSYLASLHRLSPREVERLARRVAPPKVGVAVTGLVLSTASGIQPRPAQVVSVQLAAGAAVDMAELTPALLATLKHAASTPNPAFYDRQRRRFSTWGIPRFLHSFDKTLDGRLVHGPAGVGSAADGARIREHIAPIHPRARVGGIGGCCASRSGHRGAVVAAQQVRAARSTAAGEKHRYLLSGLVRCAVCGRRLDSHWVHGRAGYRCRHGRNSARPPALDEPKIVYVREDLLIRELLSRLLPDQDETKHSNAAGMVAELRSAGILITHDGTKWSLTST